MRYVLLFIYFLSLVYMPRLCIQNHKHLLNYIRYLASIS